MKAWILLACIGLIGCGVSGNKKSAEGENAALDLTSKRDLASVDMSCTYDTLGELATTQLPISSIRCILGNQDKFLQNSLAAMSENFQASVSKKFFNGSDQGATAKEILAATTAYGTIFILPSKAIFTVAQINSTAEGAPAQLKNFTASLFAGMLQTTATYPDSASPLALVKILNTAYDLRAAMEGLLQNMLTLQTQDRDASINPGDKFILAQLYYFYLLSQANCPKCSVNPRTAYVEIFQNVMAAADQTTVSTRVCLAENIWARNNVLTDNVFKEHLQAVVFADSPSTTKEARSCNVSKTKVTLGSKFKQAKTQAAAFDGQESFVKLFRE